MGVATLKVSVRITDEQKVSREGQFNPPPPPHHEAFPYMCRLFDPMCLYSKYSEFRGEFKNG